MKLIIALILVVSVFSLRVVKEKKENEKGIAYTYSTPVYYASTPVYYTYTPSSYYYSFDPYSSYYFGSYVYPTTFSYASYPYYWRKTGQEGENAQKPEAGKKPEFKPEEAEKEIKYLKKEIFGDENYNTDEVRKSKKIYDAKWLISQLKLTRILEIEDLMKLYEENNKKKDNRKANISDVKMENKPSDKVEAEVKEKTKEKESGNKDQASITVQAKEVKKVEKVDEPLTSNKRQSEGSGNTPNGKATEKKD